MSTDERARGRTKKQGAKERERAKKQRAAKKERERQKKQRLRLRQKKQRDKERERLRKQRLRAKKQRDKERLRLKKQRLRAKKQRAKEQKARQNSRAKQTKKKPAGALAGGRRDGGSSPASKAQSALIASSASIPARVPSIPARVPSISARVPSIPARVPSIPARVPPREVIEIVREALQEIGPEGRFSPDKVFISALYDKVAKFIPMSLSRFKDWLVEKNQEQALLLGRADVVGAMDPKVVMDSEIDSLGSTFHFVVDPSRSLGFRPRSDRDAELRAEARQAALASRAMDALDGRSRD